MVNVVAAISFVRSLPDRRIHLSRFLIMAESKVLTLAEVEKIAADKEKCLMIINNRIYDVTKFMDEVCAHEAFDRSTFARLLASGR